MKHMDYNTTREQMINAEYGRNVQKLIEMAKLIEDPDKRSQYAEQIINVMVQLSPNPKDAIHNKHKLWNHLFHISNFELDVDAPYAKPTRESVTAKPHPLGYSNQTIKYRHYGHNIKVIIEKAISYEDGPEKDALIKTIANHMKKSYLSWNRESVNDEVIEKHLKDLSGGKLELDESVTLNHTNDILAKNKRKRLNPPQQNGGRKPNNNNHQNKFRKRKNTGN